MAGSRCQLERSRGSRVIHLLNDFCYEHETANDAYYECQVTLRLIV